MKSLDVGPAWLIDIQIPSGFNWLLFSRQIYAPKCRKKLTYKNFIFMKRLHRALSTDGHKSTFRVSRTFAGFCAALQFQFQPKSSFLNFFNLKNCCEASGSKCSGPLMSPMTVSSRGSAMTTAIAISNTTKICWMESKAHYKCKFIWHNLDLMNRLEPERTEMRNL